MPKFAESSMVAVKDNRFSPDIPYTHYRDFLAQFEGTKSVDPNGERDGREVYNHIVDLPLDDGESIRSVRRRLSVAVKRYDLKMRLAWALTPCQQEGLPPNTLRFKILPLQPRPIKHGKSWGFDRG